MDIGAVQADIEDYCVQRILQEGDKEIHISELSAIGMSGNVIQRVAIAMGYKLRPQTWEVPEPRMVNPAEKIALFERDAWTCRYCGQPVTRNTGSIDHIVPYSKGGLTEAANLVTACRPCNRKKFNRTPEEAGMALLPIPK